LSLSFISAVSAVLTDSAALFLDYLYQLNFCFLHIFQAAQVPAFLPALAYRVCFLLNTLAL